MKNNISLVIQKKIPSLKVLNIWVKWLNNPKVSKFSSRSFKKHTVKTQKKFLKNKILDKNCKLYLIKFEKFFVGVIELINIDLKNKNCEIRYLVGNTDLWGKGIATKSIGLAKKIAFNQLKLKTIYADTHEDNLISQRVLKKNNFTMQGKIKKFFKHNTSFRNKLIFGISKIK